MAAGLRLVGRWRGGGRQPVGVPVVDTFLRRETAPDVPDRVLPGLPPRARSGGWGDMGWLRR